MNGNPRKLTLSFVESQTVAINPVIHEFIESAKAKGAADEAVVGMLTARGWPEKHVYEALAAYYEQLIGMQIPARKSARTDAKDAFFYLVIFSTLGTWAVSLGSLAFTLIDHWFSDPLFSYGQDYEAYSTAWSMASILVAFPVYLAVSRIVTSDMRSHPEKLNSPVRRWLTYIALVIAAAVFIGDLIAALSYFLQGEITSRFLAKAAVVLVISGSIFFYYYFGLKRGEEAAGIASWHWDMRMAAASTVAVLVVIAFGFAQQGAPKTQRMLRADETRVQNLFQLSQRINGYWMTHSRKLPQGLDELISGTPIKDPLTGQDYEYSRQDDNHYQLCASFSAASHRAGNQWSHPAGKHCFLFNAVQPAETPPSVFIGN